MRSGVPATWGPVPVAPGAKDLRPAPGAKDRMPAPEAKDLMPAPEAKGHSIRWISDGEAGRRSR